MSTPVPGAPIDTRAVPAPGPVEPEPPVPDLDEQAAEDRLRDYVRVQVRSGVFDAPELRDLTIEAASAEYAEPHRADEMAQGVLFEELRDWQAEASRWTARTDCDRLDDALASLAQDGVLVLAGLSDADAMAESIRIRGLSQGCIAYLVPDIWLALDTGSLPIRVLGTDGLDAPRRSALVVRLVDTLAEHGLLASTEPGEPGVTVSMHWRRRPQIRTADRTATAPRTADRDEMT